MTRKLVALAAASVVLGCAKKVYYHPSKPAAAFEAEERECMIEAEQRAANWGTEGNVFVIKDFLEECLEARGWRERDGG